MKSRLLQGVALAMTAAMVLAGCSGGNQAKTVPETTEETAAANESAASTDSLADSESQAPSDGGEAADRKEEPASVAEISYSNISFDFADELASEREALKLVPDAADISISVADEKGATGVVLVPSLDEANTTDYYLNALVAGNSLVFTPAKDAAIASAKSSISGDIAVTDGQASLIPATILADNPVDEIITITMEDGTVYNVHTLSEMIPGLVISGEGVAQENAGTYDFAIDKFLLRVNTSRELVYYRNLGSVGELMAENFAQQNTKDGSYYTYFAELRQDFRNANGGFSSGMYVVMDENYNEIDYVTLLPNTEENHTHGEGYLDQHEFVVLGDSHYLTMSYTPLLVDNLPDDVTGIDGGSTAYVWAGIFQEVQDGSVLHEINTTDYPMLYSSAVEKIDYENSTDQGIDVVINEETVPSPADGWMDYVHPNSLDYTLDTEGNVDKLLVSMRDQCAVYQFDIDTGNIEWILGGKASTLSGYDEYAASRKDEKGNEFTALTYGQHYARYINKNEDGTLTQDPQISIFDNQTGNAPFLTSLPVPTLTRTMKVTINTEDNTASVFDVINGTDLNQKTDSYHIASHCGSVDYFNDHSVVIGWGLHGVIDNIPAAAPEGTMTDEGFADLRAGSRPVFTEYDMANDQITFELCAVRNANFQGHEALFSYRTYKTAQ